MEPTFTDADAKAAGNLVFAAPNDWRGLIALCAYWIGLPNPAYREIIDSVWNHDHHHLLKAARGGAPMVRRMFSAEVLVAALGSLGPVAMLAFVFLVTALVGLFISNSATAVLIAPVAIEAAQTLGVSPQAFAMTVAIACCAAYVTPVSSPVNMLVMEPGGYAFGDYVRVGLPLLLLTMVVTVALVAVIYPLRGI